MIKQGKVSKESPDGTFKPQSFNLLDSKKWKKAVANVWNKNEVITFCIDTEVWQSLQYDYNL